MGTPDKDAVLIRASVGDSAAFEEVYAQYRKDAREWAFKILGDWHDAEEAMEDAFLKVLKARVKMPCGQPQFKLWFRTIVIRTAIDVLRKKISRSKNEEVHPGDFLDKIGRIDASPTDTMNLKNIGESLSVVQRAILNARYKLGMTWSKIGLEMHMTRDRVIYQNKLAKQILRRQICKEKLFVRK